MIQLLMQTILGGALLWSAVAKLRHPAATRSAFATFGVHGQRVTAVLWWALIVVEAVLGIGVIVGITIAMYIAAGVLALFAGLLLVALARGRRGQPCGCFGARSRVGTSALVRNTILAGALAVTPSLGGVELSRARWTEVAAAIGAIGVVGLSVALMALAREVASLRLSVAPQLALDIEGEGPAIGTEAPELAVREADDRRQLSVGIFTSDGCPMCEALRPAIRDVARDGRLAVSLFDEHRDRGVWESLAIPGSPYAVVTDRDGIVRTKGTFNSLGQLDSLLAGAYSSTTGVSAHG